MRFLLPLLLCLSAVAQDGFLSYRVPDLAGLAKPFTPDQAPNLTIWLKPDVGKYQDAALTVATNGSKVFIWADQSGNGYNFTNYAAAAYPTNVTNVLNGYASLQWGEAGSAFGLTNNAVLPTNHWTLYLVSRKTVINDSLRVGIFGGDQTDASWINFSYWDNNTNATWGMVGIGTTDFSISGNQWYIYTAVYTTNHLHNLVRTNGTLMAIMSDASKLAAIGRPIIGGRPWSAPMGGDLVELILYASDMGNTTPGFAAVEGYLKTKYGL